MTRRGPCADGPMHGEVIASPCSYLECVIPPPRLSVNDPPEAWPASATLRTGRYRWTGRAWEWCGAVVPCPRCGAATEWGDPEDPASMRLCRGCHWREPNPAYFGSGA